LGFRILDDDLTCLAQEMGLKDERVQLLNELKESARINVPNVPGQYVNFQFKYLQIVFMSSSFLCVCDKNNSK